MPLLKFGISFASYPAFFSIEIPFKKYLIAICKFKNMHITNTMYNVCVNAPISIIKNDTVLETALISVSFWIMILIIFLPAFFVKICRVFSINHEF